MLYEFENLKDGHIELFSFSVSEAPSLGEVRQINKQKWKRIITRPPCGIVKDTVNPFSPEQFVDRSGNRKGSVGDLMDESKELAEKRKQQSTDGRDKVQDKWFDDWSTRRSGKQHPADTRPKPKTKLKTKNDRQPNK